MEKIITKYVQKHKDIRKFAIPTVKQLGWNNWVQIDEDFDACEFDYVVQKYKFSTTLYRMGYDIQFGFYIKNERDKPYIIENHFSSYEEMVKYTKNIRKLIRNKEEFLKFIKHEEFLDYETFVKARYYGNNKISQ